ncbi:MAG TPA: flagellar hook basal-body protein [Edaphobacter sp.]|jgi:flagellar basal-body rod protein FlgF/flagellar basal-body rod protein FlgG
MDSGLYAAYTGLLARTQALDTAANNLANAGTAGFRAQRDYFSGVLAGGIDQDPETASQVGQSVNGFGVLGGNRLDLGQGEIKATGNPLDLALEGQGFFAIQTSRGIRYTRDGAFSRSPTGVLQTAQGEPVLDENQKPITIPTGTIYVSPDGSISVSTADGSMIVGRVGAFDFNEQSALTAEGSNRFSANGAKPIPATASIEQGSVEGANEDAVHGTMQLVLVQRQAEMMQKALSVFNNDFDKTASEDLPRV